MNNDIDERKNDYLSTEVSLKELRRLLSIYNDEKWTILAFITSPSYVSSVRNTAGATNWSAARKNIDQKYLHAIDFCYLLENLYFENHQRGKPNSFG